MLFCNKTVGDILLRDELEALEESGVINKLTFAVTREKPSPEQFKGFTRRPDKEML